MPDQLFHRAGSYWGFGAEVPEATSGETGLGTVAGTKNKWPGLMRGEWKQPAPEYTIKDYRGGAGSRDAVVQAVKEGTMKGSLSVSLQHAWWIYWLLGGVSHSGAGPYTHDITGANRRVGATLHQVLTSNAGTQFGIDWLGCLADSGSFGVEENGELYLDADYQPLSYTSGATPVSVTALTRSPYLWETATWNFYDPGTTNALAGVSTPTALTKWDYRLGNNLRNIRGHRATNARLPVTNAFGKRDHELNLSLIPAADLTLWDEIAAGTKFDFVYKFTRAANDTLQFTWKDCQAKKGALDYPEEDQEIPMEVAIQPRTVDVQVVDSYATLIAAT